MLNPQQNKAILAKLKTAGIKYNEVYEELLDHYATAIEDKMEDKNLPFEQALNEIHKGFGGNNGVKHIEQRYYRQMFSFYEQTQWKHFRQQFQWPLAAGSLLIGGLVYALAHLLQNPVYLFAALILPAFLPIAGSIYCFFQLRKKAIYSKKTAKGNLLMYISVYAANFLTILTLGPRIFFDEILEGHHGIDLLPLYPAALSVIITFYILYLLSFIKTLQRVQFKTA